MYIVDLEVASEVETEFIEGLQNFNSIFVSHINRTHQRSVMITLSSKFRLSLEDLIYEYCDGNKGEEYVSLIAGIKELQEVPIKGYNTPPQKLRIWIVMYDDEPTDNLGVVVANSEEEALQLYKESLGDVDNLDGHMEEVFRRTTVEEATVYSADN